MPMVHCKAQHGIGTVTGHGCAVKGLVGSSVTLTGMLPESSACWEMCGDGFGSCCRMPCSVFHIHWGWLGSLQTTASSRWCHFTTRRRCCALW